MQFCTKHEGTCKLDTSEMFADRIVPVGVQKLYDTKYFSDELNPNECEFGANNYKSSNIIFGEEYECEELHAFEIMTHGEMMAIKKNYENITFYFISVIIQ